VRVGVVHSFYGSAQPSGENSQVDAEVAALRRAGVTVELFAARTDDLEADPLYRARCAIRVAAKQGASPLAGIRAFDPDVVHVHNLFPNFGRRWAAGVAVPLVATVHNFRFVCAAATLLRDGRVCTDCVDRRPWPGLRHRCYRGSLLATVPLTLSLRAGAAADPVLRRADRVLCLSPRQRALLTTAGLDEARLVDWANFLPDDLDPSPGGRIRPASERAGCVVAGRLTAEKGVVDLVGCWTGDTVLRVIGDGPDRAAVERAARGRAVEVVGRLDRGAAVAEIARARAIILPGRWPEVAPLSYLEALAAGTGIVVADTSDLAPGIVADGVGGAVRDLADVPAAVDRLAADAGLATRARRLFEKRHTEAAWVGRALRMYGTLVSGA
jgi:glycosyltransferase involved in cell wall biosynthesis